MQKKKILFNMQKKSIVKYNKNEKYHNICKNSNY